MHMKRDSSLLINIMFYQGYYDIKNLSTVDRNCIIFYHKKRFTKMNNSFNYFYHTYLIPSRKHGKAVFKWKNRLFNCLLAYLLKPFVPRRYIGHQRYSSILSCFGPVWLVLAIYILVSPSHGLCFSSRCF